MMNSAGTAAPRARNSAVSPWAVLGVGMLASYLLFSTTKDNIESSALERFDHQTIEAKRVIETRIQSYADVLYSVKALFDTDASVSRAEFHRFVESLNLKSRFPGIEVVNYAIHVPAEDKRRFEEAVRRDTSLEPGGYPSFAIKPPGERPEYHVLVYLEPMTDNEFAFGLDLAINPAISNPRAAELAQHSARDSGKLTASGLLIRVLRAKEFVGLAMRLPVYRSAMPTTTVDERRTAYLGSVGAGFNIEDLMRGAVNETVLKSLRFKLLDTGPTTDRLGASPPNARLLFDSNQLIQAPTSPSLAQDPGSILSRTLTMDVGGRTWEIQFSASRGAFIDRLDRYFPSMVLAGGLLSSLLLFGVLYSLSLSRNRALKLAAQMTKDLRETEERFRLIAETASDLIILIDPQGRRIYANPAYSRLFGDKKDLVGTDAFQEIHPEDKEQVEKAFFDTVRAHDAELVFIIGAAPQRLARNPRRAVPVLRMDERVKAVESRRHLIVAKAEDPGELVRPPSRVGPHVPFPAAEIGERLRLLELNVARPQDLVLPPPLRDVARHRDDMRDTTLRIEHGAAMALDPAYLSVRKEKPKFHVPVLAVLDGIEERLLDLFLVLGMNLPKRIGPDEIRFVSEQPAVGGIHVNPPALRVDQDDQVGGALGDQAEAFFGFAEVLRHLGGEREGAATRGGQGIKHGEKEKAREHAAREQHRRIESVQVIDERSSRGAKLDLPSPAADIHRKSTGEN